MTTQTQGKGKKKQTMKVPLEEFNQMEAPHGHSVVSVKVGSGGTGLDWAEAMADHEKTAETQQIIVPLAPRAQRGPGVDFDSLPNEPPFRVSLFNLPMSVEEVDITTRIFQGLNVIRVETNAKSSTTVELGSKQDLYDALCKDGASIKGRTINVCLYGETPKNDYGSDRYGGRGDRYGDRNQSGGFGQRSSDRGYGDRGYGDRGYGDRGSSAGGFGGSRDRDSYGSGFGRSGGGGFGGPRGSGGYGDRFNDSRGGNFRDVNRGYTSGGGEPESEESTNWRARPSTVRPAPAATPSSYNNGSRQPYTHSRPEPPHQQHVTAPSHQQYQQPDNYHQPRSYQPHHNQPSSNHLPYQQFNNQASSNNRPLPTSSAEERPKLNLKKREKPLNIDEAEKRNEAIFGLAKPTSTPYVKMHEVEEKLKNVQIGDKKE